MSEENHNSTDIKYQELGETVNFIRYSGEENFEFGGKDDKLNWDIRQIKKLLQEFWKSIPDMCFIHAGIWQVFFRTMQLAANSFLRWTIS